MVEFKIVLNTKKGKSYQREIKDDQAKSLMGKRIGDTIKGDSIGLPGYELQIAGGSDSSGFPMRKDVDGAVRKKILAVSGVGLKKKRDGQRQRKTVCGNKIYENIAQVNLKIITEGKEKLAEEAEETKEEAPAGEAPKEESKEEKPAAAKKEEKPAEGEPAEETPEAPSEEKAETAEEKKEAAAEETPKEAPAEEKAEAAEKKKEAAEAKEEAEPSKEASEEQEEPEKKE